MYERGNKKNNKKLLLFYMAVFLIAVPLTGCSIVTPLYTMTEDEENAIITYSAKIVGKYNAHQGDGLRRVFAWQFPEDEEAVEEEEEGLLEEENEEAPEDETASPSGENEGADEKASQPAIDIGINDALSINNILIRYTGFTIGENYKEGDYLSLTPSAGNKYFILHFALDNPSSEGVYADILSMHPVFNLSVDGNEGVRNSSTILLYDLTTLQSTLPGGSSTEAVLLFEVPSGIGSEASQISLKMTKDDTLYNIILN